MTGRIIRFATMVMLLMVCVSCVSNTVPFASEQAQELWENPVPTPEYISFVTRSSDEFATLTKDVCAYINEYLIWEIGSNGNDTSEAIHRTARVLVNGQAITDLKLGFEPGAIIRFDENRENELGSHNFSTWVCFDTSNFSPGYYIATLQFASKSGIGFSYTWTFWLKEA